MRVPYDHEDDATLLDASVRNRDIGDADINPYQNRRKPRQYCPMGFKKILDAGPCP